MQPAVRIAALFLALLALQPGARAGVLEDHPGYWLGDVTLPDGTLRKMGAEIFKRADGATWASVGWPEQDVVDIPVKSLKPEPDGALLLDLGAAQLKLAWNADHFDGTWIQGKALPPAQMRQVAGYPRRPRPQTPQAPFPYKNETLAIHSKDGVTLGATLSMPAGATRPPVVVLVAGSGPQTRHVDNAGHQLFDVLADHLARQGVAVLRYDKRGIARSTGDYYGHTQHDLADDAYAVVQALAARKQFGAIGLAGHSEGSQVAAAVAARHSADVGFVVSMAGVGLSGLELMLLQDRQYAVDNGAGAADLARITPYLRAYYETVMATPDGPPRIAALKAVLAAQTPGDQALLKQYKINVGTLDPNVAAQPFLPVLLKSDPRKDWTQVRGPVLVMNGMLDHQVPAVENVAGIAGALKAGGNRAVATKVLPSLNHGFQTARTGAEDEYAAIDETMAPVALQTVADFVRKQSSK